MVYFHTRIYGVPYSQHKKRGNVDGLKVWSDEVIEQTRELPKIKEACIMKVTFLLPPDKFPKDFPYGSDLDNLLKRFLDALNKTIFVETIGKDSCIISLHVTKTKVDSQKESGALLEVLPVSVT
ncbi:MAG: RusA family crossover junction endodeoxyribonuclease [Ignavibacteriales bacterium]|nr:RusA family crossover junction endodeoxyribonuclease [Ignavibacteriales bacterium]